MKNILTYYQNIPLHLDPVIFSVGSFSLGWYSAMYLVAFCVIYLLLRYRVRHDVSVGKFRNLIFDFMLYAFVGALIGGRVGYVLLYNLPYYLSHLAEAFLPVQVTSYGLLVTGYHGMSYHGSVLGIIAATWIFVRNNASKWKISFWSLADFVAPAVPAGYFFGRIGNFLNLELYGRVTGSWFGMYFPLFTGAGPLLRYPSQLFEAFLEGVVLFGILWLVRNKNKFSGFNLVVYLIGYGIVRIVVEFFREPDEQIGLIFNYFTLGQMFSAIMIIAGLVIYFRRRKLKII